MLNPKDAMQLLENILKLSDREKEIVEDYKDTFIDYHKFIMDKFELSSEEAEQITKAFAQSYVNENKTGEEDEEETMLLSVKGIQDMAVKNGYDNTKAEKMVEMTISLTELFKKKTEA